MGYNLTFELPSLNSQNQTVLHWKEYKQSVAKQARPRSGSIIRRK